MMNPDDRDRLYAAAEAIEALGNLPEESVQTDPKTMTVMVPLAVLEALLAR